MPPDVAWELSVASPEVSIVSDPAELRIDLLQDQALRAGCGLCGFLRDVQEPEPSAPGTSLLVAQAGCQTLEAGRKVSETCGKPSETFGTPPEASRSA